jgi:hypothetical protein
MIRGVLRNLVFRAKNKPKVIPAKGTPEFKNYVTRMTKQRTEREAKVIKGVG